MKYRHYILAVFAILYALRTTGAEIITDAKGRPIKAFAHEIPKDYKLPPGAKVVHRPAPVPGNKAPAKVAQAPKPKPVVPPEVQARRDARRAAIEAARPKRPDPKAVRAAKVAEFKAKQDAAKAKQAARKAKLDADIAKARADFKAKQDKAKNPNKPK